MVKMFDKEEGLWEDQIIKCVDCGDEFNFEAGEQKFYWQKGLATPKRCPACRRWRKLTIGREVG